MTDQIDPARRSWNMGRIKGKDTKPELEVRSLLHKLGFRFRLHRKGLPGTPDIVLPKYRAVIFVHGCYWHRHPGCRYAYNPKSRVAFWQNKFRDNVKRDAAHSRRLTELGWTVITVWECELREPEAVALALMENLTSEMQ